MVCTGTLRVYVVCTRTVREKAVRPMSAAAAAAAARVKHVREISCVQVLYVLSFVHVQYKRKL